MRADGFPADMETKLDTLSEPLVSVVTPVYNGEGTLRQCIESVLAQTYSNWEYVIVNNCSMDGSLAIAQEYAAKDPRITVRSNDRFVGVHANHNNGLRLISPSSAYCKVVQADDWLFPDCLAQMVRLAENHPSVAIVQAYRLQGTAVAGDGVPYPSTVMAGREACRLWLLPGRPSMFGTPTSLMYRSDIVRSRPSFYNDANLHADTEVCLEFLEHNDYGFVHQVLTYQRLRPGSVMTHMAGNQTELAARLYELVTYGPRYLTEDELARGISEQVKQYYRSLGGQVFKRRDRDFWRLHRQKMAALGYPLDTGRLARSATAYLLSLALDPRGTADRLAQRQAARRQLREGVTR